MGGNEQKAGRFQAPHGIAPGQIFSSQGQFHHYFRLSYGAPWSEKIDKALKTLGELVKRY